MDRKKIFEKYDNESPFIKVTAPPVESPQKATLNRKGNQIFNDGDVEGARRIFMTTGYSDGLARVGDYYRSQNRPLEALRMYWTAPDRHKAEPIIEQIAYLLQGIIREEDAPQETGDADGQ
jgi:hypothetical protein